MSKSTDVASPEAQTSPSSRRLRDDDSNEPPNKRRRVSLACNACRTRKTRCDGVRPTCQQCERLGFECVYEVPETATNVIIRKDYLASLEERVKALEGVVNSHNAQLQRLAYAEPAGSNTLSSSAVTLPSAPPLPPEDFESHVGPSAQNQVVGVEDGREPTVDENGTDGMANISFADEKDSGFFGPSSNMALMRHTFRAIGLRDSLGFLDSGIVSSYRPTSAYSPGSKVLTGTDVGELELNVLPSDDECKRLIREFFSNTGTLFPYIHEPTILETYERMTADRFANVRRTWLALLNMIFAMATGAAVRTEDSGPHHKTQPEMFHSRALCLCKNQILRGTSLETVQCLLLMTQYLQGTQKSIQTWTLHGLAVKSAMSIGLHSSEASRKLPLIDREMRKRAWHTCILLDRSLSMTFGRPLSIPDHYIKLDLPSPLPTTPTLSNLSDDIRNMSIAFFNATISLYIIKGRVITALYGSNLGCDPPLSEFDMATQIFKLEQELNDWQHSLPSNLALRTSSSMTNLPEQSNYLVDRFRVVTTLRYLNVQVLLRRPLLTKSVDSRNVTPGEKQRLRSIGQIQQTCNQACVKSAEDLIALVHVILTTDGLGRKFLGAWWFTLYFTFNAALVIFASLLLPKDDAADQPKRCPFARAKISMEQAIEALTRLDDGNLVLNRCVAFMRELLRITSGWSNNFSGSTNGLPGILPSDSFLLMPSLTLPSFPDQSDSLSLGLQNSNSEMASDSMDPFVGFEADLELAQFFMPNELQNWIQQSSGNGR